VFGKEGQSQILVNFPATDAASSTVSNAKTLGMRNLQHPDTSASGGLSDGARVVHHGTHELLMQQTSVSDGENTHV
jgi:hypothetical protein